MLQFPTDSFYKFLALAGVAIIIFVLYGFILLVQESTTVVRSTYDEIDLSNLKNKKLNTKDKINDLEIEIIQLQYALKTYTNSIKYEQEPEHLKSNIINSRSEQIEITQAQINQAKNDYAEIANEIELLKRNKTNYSSSEILLEHKTRVLVLSYFLIAIGALMAVYGFSAWHRHHQAPADKILALQLKKEALEIEKLDIEIENLLRI